jgi:plasmid stability protein
MQSMNKMSALTNVQSLLRGAHVATMTIRNIDEQLEARLRLQAARHGHSMEDEAHDILRASLSVEPAQGGSLLAAIRARVSPLGGVELELPARDGIRPPPEFNA